MHIEGVQVLGKGLRDESSSPTQVPAPEPMYKQELQAETQFDECNGVRKPSRQRVEELELQNSDGGVEPRKATLR